MIVNEKKPIKLENRTKHFCKTKDKTHVTFSSPDSYQSRKIKIEGYESRLYWQYRYCEDNDGQTYFYTLTYNDKAMPHYYGEPCFDYEDLRDLLTGGFRKQLLRKFGTRFKYFIGAELGDGKGERGMHNNPHYHILFFLENAHDERFPYRKILPEQFRHLVRKYWQGFDEDTDGKHDYREAKYGIAREGEDLGLVHDFRACMYCAKYVCKDVKLKRNERKIKAKYTFEYERDLTASDDFYHRFWNEVVNPMYNTLNAKNTAWQFTPEEVVYRIMPDYDRTFGLPWLEDDEPLIWQDVVEKYLEIYPNDWNKFAEFKKSVIDSGLKAALNEYRNRYCNKCRISQGVGDYALESMDIENPCVQIPSKDGFKNRPICMYYYRKLFTNVVYDEKHTPLRILNALGIEYKMARIEQQLEKKEQIASNNLDIVMQSRELYNKMKESDVNTDVTLTFDEFLDLMDYLLKENNKQEILRRYAEFKLIYEDRFYKLVIDKESGEVSHPAICPISDYRYYLTPSIFMVSRSDLRLPSFVEYHSEDYLGYFEHPYFLRYQRVFRVLDLCSDYFFIQQDNKLQKEAEEVSEVRRFHDKQKVKDFYTFWN